MLIIIIHLVHRVWGLNLDPCCWGLSIHVVLAKILSRTKGFRQGLQKSKQEESFLVPPLPVPSSSPQEGFALL